MSASLLPFAFSFPTSILLLFLLLLFPITTALLIQDASQCQQETFGARPIQQWISTVTPNANLQLEAICVGSDGGSNLPVVQYQMAATGDSLVETTVVTVQERQDCNFPEVWNRAPGSCCLVDDSDSIGEDALICRDDSSLAVCMLNVSSEYRALITCPDSGMLYLESDRDIVLADTKDYLFFPFFEVGGTLAEALGDDNTIQLTSSSSSSSSLLTSVYVVAHTNDLVYNSGVCNCFADTNMFPTLLGDCLNQVDGAPDYCAEIEVDNNDNEEEEDGQGPDDLFEPDPLMDKDETDDNDQKDDSNNNNNNNNQPPTSTQLTAAPSTAMPSIAPTEEKEEESVVTIAISDLMEVTKHLALMQNSSNYIASILRTYNISLPNLNDLTTTTTTTTVAAANETATETKSAGGTTVAAMPEDNGL